MTKTQTIKRQLYTYVKNDGINNGYGMTSNEVWAGYSAENAQRQ